MHDTCDNLFHFPRLMIYAQGYFFIKSSQCPTFLRCTYCQNDVEVPCDNGKGTHMMLTESSLRNLYHRRLAKV